MMCDEIARAAGAAMRLTRYTDYALRVLLFLAARPDEQRSIGEIVRAYGVSRATS
jgi:Rrf2 family nitric oxide-sensitive transcriptional repressor